MIGAARDNVERDELELATARLRAKGASVRDSILTRCVIMIQIKDQKSQQIREPIDSVKLVNRSGKAESGIRYTPKSHVPRDNDAVSVVRARRP